MKLGLKVELAGGCPPLVSFSWYLARKCILTTLEADDYWAWNFKLHHLNSSTFALMGWGDLPSWRWLGWTRGLSSLALCFWLCTSSCCPLIRMEGGTDQTEGQWGALGSQCWYEMCAHEVTRSKESCLNGDLDKVFNFNFVSWFQIRNGFSTVSYSRALKAGLVGCNV